MKASKHMKHNPTTTPIADRVVTLIDSVLVSVRTLFARMTPDGCDVTIMPLLLGLNNEFVMDGSKVGKRLGMVLLIIDGEEVF